MKSKLRLLAVIAIAALLSGCYAVTKSSTYYGVKTAGQNVVFLLDTSGSMEGKDEGTASGRLTQQVTDRAADKASSAIGGFLGNMVGKQIDSETTKLGSAKRALIPAIRGLEAPSRYAVVEFGGKVDTWHDDLVEATRARKNIDIVRINNLSADGGTPMLAALERGFRYHGASIIFLLTDGQPTDASTDAILTRVQELNHDRHIAIYTIGFGKDKDADFLRHLAEANGGKYIDQTHAGEWFHF